MYSVYLHSPGGGVTGDTAAIISGSLNMLPELERDPGGAVYVEADSIREAVVLAISGPVTVQFGGSTQTFELNSATAGSTAEDHRPFWVTSGAIFFEDMVANPDICDFDYNDHRWTVDVRELSENSLPVAHYGVPIAHGDYYAGWEDGTISIDAAGVLFNDSPGIGILPIPGQPPTPGAGLSAVLIEDPEFGSLSLQSNGAFEYTPDGDFSGFDYFRYRVTNGVHISFNAYVQLNVQRVIDDEVVALDDIVERDPGSGVSGDVLLNDTDYTEQAVTVTLEDGPEHGTVVLNSSGGFNYTPNAGSDLADSFQYKVTNSAGKIDFGTVFIKEKAPVGTYRTLLAGQEYTKPENVEDDAGAGVWKSQTGGLKVPEAVAKKVVISNLVDVPVLGILQSALPWGASIIAASVALQLSKPDAAAHMRHFIGNSGTDYDIDMTSLLEVKSAKALHTKEIIRAQQHAETLGIGTHKISSTVANDGPDDGAVVEQKEDANWFYAMRIYRSWGRGEVTVTDAGQGKKTYTLVFEYLVDDPYNWNVGQDVIMGGFLPVKDEVLGQMHLAGVAKEFRLVGSQTQTETWTK